MTSIGEHIGLPEMCQRALEFLESITPEVVSEGAAASVTIKLTIKPAKDGRSANVEGTVQLKRPAINDDTDDGYGGILWAGEGVVSTSDPLNPRMTL